MIDVVELDVMARETVMREHVQAMSGVNYVTTTHGKERKEFADEFLRFANWASRVGVRCLPAAGTTVGFYLLDLHSDGALTGDIERAADAIGYTHEAAGNYLDVRPIAAALNFIHGGSD